MKFTKMHGVGNDYIFVNCFEETVPDPSDTAVKLSDRHFGIGSDGLVLIEPSDKADFKMEIFNSDGSQAEMCGNAARCVAKFVYENGLTNKEFITLETLSGEKHIRMYVEKGKVVRSSVDMGVPVFGGDKKFEIDGKLFDTSKVSLGNPHCVVFADNITSLELARFAGIISTPTDFPNGVNVEVVEIISDAKIKMRVFERGSGETLACGTGACAAVAASIRRKLCRQNKPVSVILPGGELEVEQKTDGRIYLGGDAEAVFRGETLTEGLS